MGCANLQLMGHIVCECGLRLLSAWVLYQACSLATLLCSCEAICRIVCGCVGKDHYMFGLCKRLNHWLRHCSAGRCRVALSVRLVVVTVCLPCWVCEGIPWNSL